MAGAAALALVASLPFTTLGQSAAPTGSTEASPAFSPSASTVPVATDWGGLLWSAPVPGPDGHVQEVIPVGTTLVAVGSVQGTDRTSAAAWLSPDGVTWQQTFLEGQAGGEAQMRDVVATPSGLLAVGWSGVQHCTGSGEGGVRCTPLPVTIWTSVDGTSWTRSPSSPVLGRADVTGLASGPSGLVAVGQQGFDQPRLWTSADGTTWQAEQLPRDVFGKAQFDTVASVPGGWIILGAVGGTAPVPGGGAVPNGSKGAAWLSPDGQTWHQAAHIAGKGPQVELRTLYQGAGGLVALGTRTGGQQGTVWTSSDGERWVLAPPVPAGIYARFPMAADGQRIIGDSEVTGDLESFAVSGDGITWRTLVDLGATDTMPHWTSDAGAPTADSAFVLPDGVLFVGEAGGKTVTWRTTAVPVEDVPAPSPSAS